jgi:hypothetical protein
MIARPGQSQRFFSTHASRPPKKEDSKGSMYDKLMRLAGSLYQEASTESLSAKKDSALAKMMAIVKLLISQFPAISEQASVALTKQVLDQFSYVRILKEQIVEQRLKLVELEAQRDAIIKSKDSDIAAKDAVITAQNEEIAAQKLAIETLTAQASQAEANADKKDAEARELKSQLAIIKENLSKIVALLAQSLEKLKAVGTGPEFDAFRQKVLNGIYMAIKYLAIALSLLAAYIIQEGFKNNILVVTAIDLLQKGNASFNEAYKAIFEANKEVNTEAAKTSTVIASALEEAPAAGAGATKAVRSATAILAAISKGSHLDSSGPLRDNEH